MKKRFLVLGIILALAFGVTAQASSYKVQEEETEDSKVYTLTFQETQEGKVEKADISKTITHEGIEYSLISADIEYVYDTFDERKAVNTVTERLPLHSDAVTHIPRYKETEDTVYVLDEESITVSVTGTAEKEGADVVTTDKTITGLPDNDLVRIPKNTEHEGITYELLYVVYEVTASDEYGVPSEYTAVCKYGGLDKYTVSYDSEWEAVVTYTGYQLEKYIKSSTIKYVYQYIEPIEVIEEEVAEPEPVEEPEQVIVAEVPEEPKKQQTVNVAAVAAATVGGIMFAVVGAILLLTVPVYAALGTGKYKYIGRMRLKRKDDLYEGQLKESLADKAEIGNFMIKIPKHVQERCTVGMVSIVCPDGNVIRKRMQDEVLFKIV